MAQSSSTCSRICVAGLSRASSLNGGYVRREEDGEFSHWQHETRQTILEQGTDGRWAFVLEGTVLAESLVAQSSSASNVPFEDVFLTQDGDAIVSFLCCDGGSSGSVSSGDSGGQDDGSMLLIGALGGAVAFFTVLGFVALAYYSRYCTAAKAASPKAAVGSGRLPVSVPSKDRQEVGRLTPTAAASVGGAGGGATAYKEVGKGMGGTPVASAAPRASPAAAACNSNHQSALWQAHSPSSTVPARQLPRDHQASHMAQTHQNLKATATAYNSSIPRAPSAPATEVADADRMLLAEAAEESWQQMLASTWHPQHAAAGEDNGRDRVMEALSANDHLRQDARGVKSLQLPGSLFPFEVGDRVVLGGFSIAEDTWNGSQGILEALDLERGRCQVRLEDGRSKAVPVERVLRYAS